MPSVEEVARIAKDNLRSSLMVTHNLTISSSSPSDFVLHRMNEVLRAVIDTNFAIPSMDAVGELYAVIGDVSLHMTNAHDLALVNFSRTFAVVLEEAIKMKGKPTGSAGNNNNNNTSGTSGGAWGNTAQRSGSAGRQASNGSYGGPTAPSQSAGAVLPLKGPQQKSSIGADQSMDGRGRNNKNNTSSTSGGPWGNTAKSSGIDVMRPLSDAIDRRINRRSQSVDVRGKSPALLPLSQGLNGKPAAAPWTAEVARRKEKEERKDYSPEAIKGRVVINKIPTTVTELQLRGHFEQIGEILSLSYPIAQGKHKGIAFLKFKDNETADEVVGHLNGTSYLGGSPLVVERAKFWYKKDPVPVFGTGRANVGTGPDSGTDSRLARYSSKIDNEEVD